jgi:hypothetical protein
MWPFSRTEKGYALLSKRGLVQRLVCEALRGGPPTSKHQASHLCGKGHLGCCNPKHIVWETQKENDARKITHGTMSWGERSGSAKLKLEDISRIRALEGIANKTQIAEMFGVSRSTIHGILQGRIWSGACPPSLNQPSSLRPFDKWTTTLSKRGHSGGSSEYKGVSKSWKKWAAEFMVHEKKVLRATFDREVEAARAYNTAAMKYGGGYARLNLIPGDHPSILCGVWRPIAANPLWQRPA